jgi:uncharacterized phage protein (TIGR01671 family)
MREILFRGKRVDNGEWVEGDLIHRYDFSGNKENEFGNIHIKPIGKIESEVHTESVGQFTGLLDKNGKRIFEGDVLTSTYGDGEPYSINFGPFTIWGEYGIENFIGFYTYPENSPFGLTIKGDTKAYTVIGNIHDNPELLNQ